MDTGEKQILRAADVGTVTVGSAPVDKHPQMRALYDTLKAERAQITAKLDPLRQQRDDLVASIAPQDKQIRELGTQIKEMQSGRLFELDNQIAALARAMGARSTSNPQPATAEGG